MSAIFEDLSTLFNLERDSVMTNSSILLEKLARQREIIQIYGERIVPAGLELLQLNLEHAGNQEPERLARSIQEIDWKTGEELIWSKYKQGKISADEYKSLTKINSLQDMPSDLFKINFHLWIQSLVKPIRSLGQNAETYLVDMLESPDYKISCLACMLVSFGDFKHLKIKDKLLHILKMSSHTAQELQFAHALFLKGNKAEFKKSVVPCIIPNKNMFDEIMKAADKKRRDTLFSFVNEIVLWDIATNGKGPVKRWSYW